MGGSVSFTGPLQALLEREPAGYSIDSRTLRPNDLFFAIKGTQQDGHRFVGEVLARGAIAAVVSGDWQAQPEVDVSRLIAVDDPLCALRQLASTILKVWKGQLIGITGSMGKTTTKEMTAAVLATKGQVIRTVGNLNNVAHGI
jgi:UDP-N-acetylmuramoyl-tripeptide--D-alanyl-D-alanine ligase